MLSSELGSQSVSNAKVSISGGVHPARRWPTGFGQRWPMTDHCTDDVEQSLREIIRWKEESEMFLLGVVLGSFAVLIIGLLKVLVRSLHPETDQ